MYDAQIFLVGFMQVLNYILYTSILIYVVNPPQSKAHLIRKNFIAELPHAKKIFFSFVAFIYAQ